MEGGQGHRPPLRAMTEKVPPESEASVSSRGKFPENLLRLEGESSRC